MKKREKETYYEILGIDKGATQKQVKNAYTEAAFELHANRQPEEFERLAEVYAILSDPGKRIIYDQEIEDGVGSRARKGSVQQAAGKGKRGDFATQGAQYAPETSKGDAGPSRDAPKGGTKKSGAPNNASFFDRVALGEGKKKNNNRKKKGSRVDLVDVVFQWSIKVIMNDHRYKDQVKLIPETFRSVGQYLESFLFPLIEETRSDLCGNLKNICHAPICRIHSVQQRGRDLVYDMDVEFLGNDSIEGGGENYKPRNGDILALSKGKPIEVADLKFNGKSHVFVVVINPPEDEVGPVYSIKVRASNSIDAVEGQMKDILAVYLINITTNNHIWSALELGKSQDLKMIKDMLKADSSIGRRCDICSPGLNDNVSGSCSLELNESQKLAVLSCLRIRECNHKNSVKLIWGPPGTGKTKTISTLLRELLRMESRTLTCAPTNVAIKEVVKRIVTLVEESCELDSCSLGDVVLFGNESRLNIDDSIQDVFLDYRAEKLAESFARLSGWNAQLKSMIAFLEDCSTEYHMHIENIISIAGKHETMWAYFKRRFTVTAKTLKNHIGNLRLHLPTVSLSTYIFEKMTTVLNLLDSFENLFRDKSVRDKDLEEHFMHSEKDNDATVPSTYSVKGRAKSGSTIALLCKKRNEFLQVLRDLQQTFKLPVPPSKDFIKNICLEGASLIFCTASSSFRLLKVQQPIELLLIDDAAQLKECESLIPLQLKGIRHAILIGDECQLPAMVKSEISGRAGFGRSLFERLVALNHAKHQLDVQYRMHPSISSFPNARFYNNGLSDASKVNDKSYEKHYLQGPMYGAYSFISVPYGREDIDNQHSKKNIVEVAVVSQIVENLLKASISLQQRISVGVISPYKAQVFAIKKKLGKKYETYPEFNVMVKSVDEFQGGEDDIIIISTVRSNERGLVGFLSDNQRTNVALTRARHCLWIVGNERTLVDSGSVWKEVVHNSKERECFFSASEDEGLVEAMACAVTKLEDLNKLLHVDSLPFRRAKWKVLFSDEFRNSFVTMNISTRHEVIEFLMKLSEGWRPKKRKHRSSTELLKQYNICGLCLLATIEIVKSLKQSSYLQVLKIWNILPPEEAKKQVVHLHDIFAKYTNEYISCCKLKDFHGELEVPGSWQTCPRELEHERILEID